jgi:hypothetical protein
MGVRAVRPLCWLLPLCFLGLAGCVTLDVSLHSGDRPPTGPVAQVVTTWETEVYFVPDPVNGGSPTPGLAGRLYLFGPDQPVSLAGDGSLLVKLTQDDAPGPDGQPRVLEQWEIDPRSLSRLLHKNRIGWGYTLFMPLGSYNESITHVHLVACYRPKDGAPLYAMSQALTLQYPQRPQPLVPPRAALQAPRPAPAGQS